LSENDETKKKKKKCRTPNFEITRTTKHNDDELIVFFF